MSTDKDYNEHIDYQERIHHILDEFYNELIDDKISLERNEIVIRYPVVRNIQEIQREIDAEEEEIKPVRMDITTFELLEYGEYYLSISLEKTQVIEPRVRQLCNKHGFDFGHMIIFNEPPAINPRLGKKLLIKLVDINKGLE